jgi:phosphoenolpyruvate carboxykinase (ATP)
MLVERVKKHGARVWMLNTGWVGGAYGVGKRISIAHTRAIVRAVVEGRLDDVPTRTDPVFKVQMPEHVPDVPDEVLRPRDAWPEASDYDRQAVRLRGMFEGNYQNLGESASEAG